MDQINQLAQLGEDERGKLFTAEDWAKRLEIEWLPAARVDFEQKEEMERDGLIAKEAISAVSRSKMLLADTPERLEYTRTRYISFQGWVMDCPHYTLYWLKQLHEATAKESKP